MRLKSDVTVKVLGYPVKVSGCYGQMAPAVTGPTVSTVTSSRRAYTED